MTVKRCLAIAPRIAAGLAPTQSGAGLAPTEPPAGPGRTHPDAGPAAPQVTRRTRTVRRCVIDLSEH
jgi:hypothetical protein